MRDRLIEFVKGSLTKHIDKSCLLSENIADDLLANGIIVPPCKVGDVVYVVAEASRKIVELTVIGVWFFGNSFSFISDCGTIHHDSIGETVFLTREEAEQALKGGERE